MRYVLVARSPSGSQNVSFEGLRCAAAQQRLYATGQSDSTWMPARASWQPTAQCRGAWQRRALPGIFLSAKAMPIRDAAEGVAPCRRAAIRSRSGLAPCNGR